MALLDLTWSCALRPKLGLKFWRCLQVFMWGNRFIYYLKPQHCLILHWRWCLLLPAQKSLSFNTLVPSWYNDRQFNTWENIAFSFQRDRKHSLHLRVKVNVLLCKIAQSPADFLEKAPAQGVFMSLTSPSLLQYDPLENAQPSNLACRVSRIDDN